MSAIIEVYGRQILDSRGNPTVEVEVFLDDGEWDAQQFLRELLQENMKS